MPDTFLTGGGELARRIADHPWAATSLGPIAVWPQSIRTSVGLILRSPVPIVTLWGSDGIMIYNDAYAVFAGQRHPRLLGSKVREGWPEVADFNDNVMKTVLTGRTLAYQDQELVLNRSGRPEQVWMNLDYSPILDEFGHPQGVVAIVVETTGKVLAERRLQVTADALARLNTDLEQRVAARTAELDRVWRNSRDLLGVVDAGGIFRALNPAWRSILGHDPDALVGRSFREIIWPDDLEPTLAALASAAASDNLTGFENRYRHRDGTPRWISWNTSVEGDLVYAYGRDVTAEKMQAEALQFAEDLLRQSQKMEAVGQLTGGIAHDFNNLLTIISGSLELLETRARQGRIESLERYLVPAQRATERAASLTHRLLAFSRRQTLDPRPTDVARLVAGMEELIRRTVGPAITVERRTDPDLWTALIDPNQLESALLNLCINARDAMPDGGRIVIETANRTLAEADARKRELHAGDYLLLRVVDSGTGMPDDVLARVFEPFFTTKPIGQGTGLGLSMIYGFVHQSGGAVHIDSAPGRGTEVDILLPRHAGEPPVEVAAAGPEPGARDRRGETVVVVDDEPEVRMLIGDILDELGFDHVEAGDGPGALALVSSAMRIDLLITDIGLPCGMNGRQLADAARLHRPDLKILFVTGYAESAAVRDGRLEPGMHVLTKPFAIETITSRILEFFAPAADTA